MFKDAAVGLLKTVAPTIATAVLGPLGGVAIGFLSKKLLGKDNATADEISNFVTQMRDPEQLVQLKALDQEFKLKMEELGVKTFELEVDDRKSAREMAIKSDKMAILQIVVAVLTMGLFCVTNYLIITGGVVTQDTQTALIVGTAIGNIATLTGVVFSFLYGTTKDSGRKTDELSKALQSSITGK
jgi:hypothetical protein